MAEWKPGQGGGLAAAVLGDIDLLRPQRGRVNAGPSGAAFRFSPRASQLWRFALGSHAAVLKKISKGGTSTAKELRAQMDYLFSKSASIFGNAVEHDPNARGLAVDERQEIAETWSDAWEGAPKNGQTSHLLLSFPSHVRPETAGLIAEAWAFEMFQSGAHQDEEWAYVAALHTDRGHPHVHIVVNNRGLVNEEWFFMARAHHFNLAMMKGRMVEIAAEEGVFLDATSRAERGILSYGPSRAEIERAKDQGRAPVERQREGKALEDALATVTQSAEALRGLAHVAALTGLPEIATRIGAAEAALQRGGVLHPFPAEVAPAEVALAAASLAEAAPAEASPAAAGRSGRADLERHLGGWMSEATDKIARQPIEERGGLRSELYAYAGSIARDLGDRRGAALMEMPPRTALYGAAMAGPMADGVRLDRLRLDDVRLALVQAGANIGLDASRLQARIESGAANAFEERGWLRDDLTALAGRNQLDLRRDGDGQRAVAVLDGFHRKAAQVLGQSHGAEVGEDIPHPLLRTLRTMARVFPLTGTVSFDSDEQAGRFSSDLRKRYGDGIARDLAAGQTGALAGDFGDQGERKAIATAIVSAAKAHPGMGLTLREAERADRKARRHVRHQDRELE